MELERKTFPFEVLKSFGISEVYYMNICDTDLVNFCMFTVWNAVTSSEGVCAHTHLFQNKHSIFFSFYIFIVK